MFRSQEGAEFPLEFNNHVIVDRASGKLYKSAQHSPFAAMKEIFSAFKEEYPDGPTHWDEDQQDKAMKYGQYMAFLRAHPRLEDSGHPNAGWSGGIVTLGGLETEDLCIHEKNVALAAVRYREVMLGSEITDEDRELSKWIGENVDCYRVIPGVSTPDGKFPTEEEEAARDADQIPEGFSELESGLHEALLEMIQEGRVKAQVMTIDPETGKMVPSSLEALVKAIESGEDEVKIGARGPNTVN
jgi:hypothetical protein